MAAARAQAEGRPGGGNGNADCLTKDPGLLVRGRGRLATSVTDLMRIIYYKKLARFSGIALKVVANTKHRRYFIAIRLS
jgi:hypothetical protein